MLGVEDGRRSSSARMSFTNFRKSVWAYYRAHGRHDLPWRRTKNPYRILVSEVMLQQTQVERVIPFYHAFLKRFPTARKLALAPLSEVLKVWQGLGYNRRAKMLHAASRIMIKSGMPYTVEALEELPGIGSYTARAVAAFAFNRDVVFIETNIRTAVTHYFFKNRDSIADADIVRVLERVLPKGKSREWYSALMDYGAHLKRSGFTLNTKSKHYVKQKAFVGSLREARGAIVRRLARGAADARTLTALLGEERRAQMRVALSALIREQLVVRRGSRYLLPE